MLRSLLFVAIFVVGIFFKTNNRLDIAVCEPSVEKQISLNEFRLVISGDIMQHLPQVNAARRDSGYHYNHCFQYVLPLWQSGDFTVVNLETTITDDGEYSGYPRFKSPAAIVDALKESGVTVVALANNHICDGGEKGIVCTIDKIKNSGLKYLGAYSKDERELLILEKDFFRVALLNYTYGTNGIRVPKNADVNLIDSVRILEDITEAKAKKATHIVAYMHWGEEYELRANKLQQGLAKWLIDNGVDVVIGSHPHVVQNIDTVNNVVYSLGNFMSNQKQKHTDVGLTAIVTLSHNQKPHIETVKHRCDVFATDLSKRYRVIPY